MLSQLLFSGRKYALIFFILLSGYAYFMDAPYKRVEDIHPAVLAEPLQTPIEEPQPIKFVKDGYSYTLQPLYDYDMYGLILHELRYDRWFSLSRTDKTFTKDICLIWGSNVSNGSFKEPTFKVKQDFRFCIYSWWSGDFKWDARELSNNHLIASTKGVESVLRKMKAGDQVEIKGQLVNVKAHAVTETGTYEIEDPAWRTSTTRNDTGGGACEVIYVTDAKILRSSGGNPLLMTGLIGSAIILGLYTYQRKKFRSEV